MSLRTGIHWQTLADEDWETLLTYQAVLDEMDGTQPQVDGKQTLIQMAQKYGG